VDNPKPGSWLGRERRCRPSPRGHAIAHHAGSCRGDDDQKVERFNDAAVEKSRSQTPEQVLTDFTKWTKRGITASGVFP
jgi:hypothetical protein